MEVEGGAKKTNAVAAFHLSKWAFERIAGKNIYIFREKRSNLNLALRCVIDRFGFLSEVAKADKTWLPLYLSGSPR